MDRRDVVKLLEWWGEWVSSVESRSPLGFPSETVEARAKQGGGYSNPVSRSKVPTHIDTPGPLEPIVFAVRNLDPGSKLAIYARFSVPGKESEKIEWFRENAKCGRTTYYEILNNAVSFVGGVCLAWRRSAG